MAFNNMTPTVVRQKEETLDQISWRLDPEWIKDRNYLEAYRFSKRVFIDHRDNVYQENGE